MTCEEDGVQKPCGSLDALPSSRAAVLRVLNVWAGSGQAAVGVECDTQALPLCERGPQLPHRRRWPRVSTLHQQ